ncbi:hypothetical protein EASAB2608_06195 [Streptomyces sp. EAS-AB2608]|uniref:hypothetical protein n=1 Tax=Streptomyces sp. EAS-AB2608 TaxID=2779671 RepID=UPI001BEF8698|nr:hypothetical protein [Streptomyces sp. EAS-AB2608]BCM70861.1 hypothetical protein EASAB2608_06195 [Streptomyces sp. EAS-AB2608]
MTTVIAGQQVTLLAQFYDFQGGTLTDLDTTPTITITSVATGSTALAATTSGVTHPATGSYGYAWTPTSSLAAGLYLATWTGLKSGSAVTATETITVTAPATASATNTSPDGVWYATREEVKAELDVKETSRSNQRIDRALEDASRRVEGLMHRRFYPVQATRYFDWPARPGAYTPWVLRLDDNELISVTTLASGGTVISSSDYNLEPNRSGPPFSRVEIKLSSSAAYGGGDTYQRDVQITGLWGYRNTETTAGTLAEALDATETGVDVDAATSAAVGVGSVLRIDSERMLVTGRSQLSTGQTLGGAGLTNINNSVTVAVQSGTAFAAGEVILIDAERMLVEDVVGNNLIVRRAWDGSTIAAHTAGATIYAPRTLTVTRGALGTIVDPHATGSTVHLWTPPGPIRQLTIAEALTDLLQGRSGYARTAGSGESEREMSGRGLKDLRAAVYAECGRKARMRSV